MLHAVFVAASLQKDIINSKATKARFISSKGKGEKMETEYRKWKQERKTERRKWKQDRKLERRKWKQYKFYPVSKRARAAYLILCLEEVLKFYEQDFEKWEWVLKKLWEITTTSDIEEWIFQVCDLTPEEALPYSTYEELEAARKNKPIYFPYSFTAEQLTDLQNLYRETEHFPLIESILDNIYFVIADDWGECETPNTPTALAYIEKTEQLLTENQIPLPNDEQTLSFLMRQKDKHSGKPFPGRNLFHDRH